MISPETIALVKERTDLVSLVGETVRLVRRGRSFTGLCPFHKEKSPSFHVNPERGFFHCFGCKESGGAVDFVMKIEGRTFPEAIRLLAERSGIEITESQTDDERKEANAARRAKDDLYAVNSLAATYFERSLRGAPHPLASYARDELARRGLALPDQDDAVGEAARIPDTLQAFRIGYAPWGWDGLATFFRQQGVSPLAAEKVGLLVPRSSGSGHYDRFRHRLMFAVIDVMGRVIAFSGRALADPAPAEIAALGLSGPTAAPDGPPAKYINSPESPIYTKGEHLFGLHQARQTIRTEGEAILVEGNFDVVALHARGISNAVAPLGTAFTPAQAKLLKRFAPNVTILFDGDAAGKKATRAADDACNDSGLDARAALLPNGLDPDDFVRQRGVESLKKLVKNAKGLHEHIIDTLLDADEFDQTTLSERLQRAQDVGAYLFKIRKHRPDLHLMTKTYADNMAGKLLNWQKESDVGQERPDLRQLLLILERATSGPSPELKPEQVAEGRERARSRPQVEEVGWEMVGSLIDFPELLDDPEVDARLGLFENDCSFTIIAIRANYVRTSDATSADGTHEADARSNKGIYADRFLAQIPRSIHSFAAGRLVSSIFDTAGEAKSAFLENAKKLQRLSLRRRKLHGVNQLHRIETHGDADAENEILREIGLMAREKQGLR